MAYQPALAFADSMSVDAFERLKVASPQQLFDAQFTYNLQPLLFEQITNGTGATITHDATNRNALLTFSSTPTGGQAIMQSYEWLKYQPGRAQEATLTGNFLEHAANCKKFVMYGDGSNGVSFESNGTGFQVTLYSDSGAGDQTVLQANWDDPLDGTGRSGVTLDVTKGFIFGLDMQALYHGRVRCCLDIDGRLVKFHEFMAANVIADPYIQTANLPIRAGMTCTGTVSTTMKFTCSTVVSSGGQPDEGGFHFSAESSTSLSAASGARTHAISLRPKTTFNSIANRTRIVPESIEIVVTGNNPVLVETCYGQALTTPSFADANATYSAVQVDTAGTLSGSPAIVADKSYAASGASTKVAASFGVPSRYPITLNAAGAVRDLGTLTVLVTGLGGNSACRVSINWKELR